MARSATLRRTEEQVEPRSRRTRLGFRVDAETKKMVERAATLERRSMTDYCLAVITEATRETIARHETLKLSARDREVFFDALVHPPKVNERLRRAFREMREQVIVE
jgi:uncharacterized protein (DUF1778 family)